MDQYRIPLEKLKKVCSDEEELEYCDTSQDVPPFEKFIGQERAIRAMQFGLNMEVFGYNIFVTGFQGTGKSTYTEGAVTKAAAQKPVPNDWCYINNFNDRDKPLAVELPAGQGRIFQKDMDALILDL
ncbi:MAG: AAA family ATPase, partial [Eubacteriaceae bacterium]|nr:AAA family ATPase [Eubacteriaceae bacterium]